MKKFDDDQTFEQRQRKASAVLKRWFNLQASSLDDNNSVLIRQAPSGMLNPLPFLHLLPKPRSDKQGSMRYGCALKGVKVP